MNPTVSFLPTVSKTSIKRDATRAVRRLAQHTVLNDSELDGPSSYLDERNHWAGA